MSGKLLARSSAKKTKINRMITLAHISKLMRESGVRPQFEVFDDKFYRCPSKEWAKDTFCPALAKYFQGLSMGASHWTRTAKNCAKNARMAHAYAAWLWGETEPYAEEALAFGVFRYMDDIIGGHAINFGVEWVGYHSEKGSFGDVIIPELSLFFLDPQTQSMVELSDNERSMCLGYTV